MTDLDFSFKTTVNVTNCDQCPYKGSIYEQGLSGDFCFHKESEHRYDNRTSHLYIPEHCPERKVSE